MSAESVDLGKTDRTAAPSFKWTLKPPVTKMDNMLRIDFKNPSLDAKFNTTYRSNVRLISRSHRRASLRPRTVTVPSSTST
ncbi:hypothetical protein PR003_g25601 [Phytophthora rubi]|uniref:Uncharacterized protein n=1 Tax=Phytophthora rubi TaxID=129364 RepID=A0A6A3IH36_9STRA|nr:hypothetical protein PR002_g25011 [Phytophthora rubi]KAE8979003.1 hypothetical protein PR001_g24683 [Phytophthora rubi]KAE9289258.1 hypothetical protein PR003_g25601 [Phytophthora rubi]